MRSPKKIVDMSKEFSTDKILGLLFTPKAAVLIRLVLSALRVNSVKNERLELSLIRAMWGGEKDPELKHSLGLALTQNYSFDGFATRHNVDHLKEALFLESYSLGQQTKSWGKLDVRYRAYIVCWVANKVVGLEGDFVECGVNRGALSRAVINYTQFYKLDKTFYLLDTFKGLEDQYITEKEKALGIHSGRYSECYDAVKNTFSEFPNVEIIRGPVPETLPRVQSSKISYLSIDMNCTEPSIAAAEYFWDKLVSGAIIVLDDYGWRKHIEQKLAFDSFAKRKSVQVLALPTGQGLIFKP